MCIIWKINTARVDGFREPKFTGITRAEYIIRVIINLIKNKKKNYYQFGKVAATARERKLESFTKKFFEQLVSSCADSLKNSLRATNCIISRYCVYDTPYTHV